MACTFTQQSPEAELKRRQKSSYWTARAVPVLLTALIGYASYVIVKVLGVDYLIDGFSHYSIGNRPGAGIAIIVFYFVLLLPVLITYTRLLIGTLNTEYIDIVKRDTLDTSTLERPRHAEKPSIGTHGQPTMVLDIDAIFKGDAPPPPGTEAYYTKDTFACDENGLPQWCATCAQWKPDRVHHCSDVGRCVAKFDHFCPWVGGVVAEKSFKFFIQFNFYTCLYTLYMMIIMAVFVHDRKSHNIGINANLIVILALSCIFTLFTGSMAANCMNFAIHNRTTVEDINHKNMWGYLAIYLRDPSVVQCLKAVHDAATSKLAAQPSPAGTAPSQSSSRTAIATSASPDLPPFVVTAPSPGPSSIVGIPPSDYARSPSPAMTTVEGPSSSLVPIPPSPSNIRSPESSEYARSPSPSMMASPSNARNSSSVHSQPSPAMMAIPSDVRISSSVYSQPSSSYVRPFPPELVQEEESTSPPVEPTSPPTEPALPSEPPSPLRGPTIFEMLTMAKIRPFVATVPPTQASTVSTDPWSRDPTPSFALTSSVATPMASTTDVRISSSKYPRSSSNYRAFSPTWLRGRSGSSLKPYPHSLPIIKSPVPTDYVRSPTPDASRREGTPSSSPTNIQSPSPTAMMETEHDPSSTVALPPSPTNIRSPSPCPAPEPKERAPSSIDRSGFTAAECITLMCRGTPLTTSPTAPSNKTTAEVRGDDKNFSCVGTITYPLVVNDEPSHARTKAFTPRTFAIMRTPVGSNPYDLGFRRNWQEVMGLHWWDWFLPLKHSPCCDHERDDSRYEFGHVVRDLRSKAGIF